MNTKQLAPIFLDDQPVELTDARPKVSAILAAGGQPEATEVKWLKSSSDTQGKALRSEEVVDRTAQPGPIYLSSGLKDAGAGQGNPGGKPGEGRKGEGGEGGKREGGKDAPREAERQGSPGRQASGEQDWEKPAFGGGSDAPMGKPRGGGEPGGSSESSAREAPDSLDKPSA